MEEQLSIAHFDNLDKTMKSLEKILWSNKFSTLNIEFTPDNGTIKINVTSNDGRKEITGKGYH